MLSGKAWACKTAAGDLSQELELRPLFAKWGNQNPEKAYFDASSTEDSEMDSSISM